MKPFSVQQLERPLDERELQPHDRPLEIGEARARHPRPRLEVDEVAEQLHVVASLGARLADLAQHLVGGRRARVGQVRQRGERGRAALLDRL